MLHLLTGSDRVLLTDQLMNILCEQAAQGQQGQILVVPEQFSHEAERRLCELGGETISRYAEVLSLSRMADRVSAVHGGAAAAYLDRGGRVLAMALAAEQTASRIKLFAAVLRKPEFLAQLVQIMEEFQSYCLQPSALLHAAARAEGQFALKLEELALLYDGYLAVCDTGRADPAQRLQVLRTALQDTDWAASRSFYFDGFSDFTGAELEVLQALMQQGKQLWIALPAGDEDLPVFQAAADTMRTLRNLAQRLEIPVQLHRCRGKAPRTADLQQLLEQLFGTAEAVLSETNNLRLCSFDHAEEECRQAVHRVKELASAGCRYRDITIACTDFAVYEPLLRAAMQMAGIPGYFAGETDILGKPVLSAVLHALQAATGRMDYQETALYLKSGLPLLEQDRCDRLDAYAYLWNIRGSQWAKPFSMHPQGFGLPWTPQDEQVLQQLEQDRVAAMAQLLQLRQDLRQAANTGEMVLAVDRFFETMDLRSRLQVQAQRHMEQGRGQLAQELQQLYEILCTSLEQMYLILGNTVRSPEDFVRLYRLLLTQYRVGTIPAGLDQVHVSSLPDLRHRRTEHLLVLGASDGSFPAYKTADGLLTEEERKRLLSQGMTLAPCRADQMDREMGSIYAALCAARGSLWMSYAGEQPAWLYRRAALLAPMARYTASETVALDLPSYAAWRLRSGKTESECVDGLEAMEQILRGLRAYDFTPVTERTVKGLYGQKIYLSASRIDKYAACRFAFFLTYGLKAKPRRQAGMDASAFGTMVHDVLEKTVLQVKERGGFRQVEEQELLQIAMDALDAYAKEHIPEQAMRDAFLFRRSREEILDVVHDLGEELRRSLFQPEDCELEFSNSGKGLPPIQIQGQRALCEISGFVDRVDLYEEDGTCYVRVVDYKTGRKSFDYTDVLNGAGLQMLIYLFALRQYGDKLYHRGQLEPAGVLYLPARRDYQTAKQMPDENKTAAMHMAAKRRSGLIRDDAHLLAAMEQDPDAPRFMPYQIKSGHPVGDLADSDRMILLERHVLRTLAEMTDNIVSGDVLPNPTDRGGYGPCNYCDYADVCHKDLCKHDTRVLAATPAAMFWEKLQEEEEHHG